MTYYLLMLLSSAVLFSNTYAHKKTVNLDKTGDISITGNNNCFCSSNKSACFSSSTPHKVIVRTGAVLNIGSLGDTVIFSGKTDLVVEAGGSLNFTGQTLCMTGSTKIIFLPPT